MRTRYIRVDSAPQSLLISTTTATMGIGEAVMTERSLYVSLQSDGVFEGSKGEETDRHQGFSTGRIANALEMLLAPPFIERAPYGNRTGYLTDISSEVVREVVDGSVRVERVAHLVPYVRVSGKEFPTAADILAEDFLGQSD